MKPKPRVERRCCAAVIAAIFASAAGCLRSLDESHIVEGATSAGASGTGATGGALGSGGTLATGGSGATDASGGSSGSAGASGGAAGHDGGPPPVVFVPYDAAKFPVKDIAGNLAPPVLIAVDGSDVFSITKNVEGGVLVKRAIAGGPGTPVETGLQKPNALATTPTVASVFVAGGRAGGTQAGSMFRIGKGGGTEEIDPGVPIELGVGIAADDAVYVNARSLAPGNPSVLRFALAPTQNTATPLYTTTTPNESGGDIAARAGCVYFVSSGRIYVTSSAASELRSPALETEINDAVGVTTDLSNFYYTRSNGEVWQRTLAPSACDGSGATEQKIAEGFSGIGDVIAYQGTVAWTAKDFTHQNADGGGVFTTPAGGGDITQIAPTDYGPEAIDQGPSDVIYTTSDGRIRRVSKTSL
jgi:hypothetical protein